MPDAKAAPAVKALFDRLKAATEEGRNPFRWPFLATVKDEPQPDGRVVVLREVRDGQLIFFTDHRSAKVAHLRANPEATLVFFDPGALLQIRASGKVTLHNQDGVAAQYWATLKPDRQKEYQTVHAPGKHYSEHGSHMNPAFGDRFFMVVAATINHFDQLQLGRPEHRRIRFCNSRGGWSAERLIP